MSKQVLSTWPLDHPEITAIALDIAITPSRRAHYSSLVLMLADAALERLKRQMAGLPEPENIPQAPVSETPG